LGKLWAKTPIPANEINPIQRRQTSKQNPQLWDVGLQLLVRWGLHGIFDFMIPQATSQPLESAERHCRTSKNVHPRYTLVSLKVGVPIFCVARLC
jgi:hypothetical protein